MRGIMPRGRGLGLTLRNEAQRLALTKAIRACQADKLTWDEMATELKQTANGLRQFARCASFRRCAAELDRQVDIPVAVEDVETVVQDAKAKFARLAPSAVEFYQDCFQRHPEGEWAQKGKWIDKELAERAAAQVAKGIGLTEPEQAVRPIIQINLAHMQFQMNQVAEEDARAARAIDVTPSPDR